MSSQKNTKKASQSNLSTPGKYIKCESSQCMTCEQDPTTSKYQCSCNEEKCECNVGCKSKNIIFLLKDKKTGWQYIDHTSQELHVRMNTHRRSFSHPLYRYLWSKHVPFKDLSIDILGHNEKWTNTERKDERDNWIQKLETDKDGINGFRGKIQGEDDDDRGKIQDEDDDDDDEQDRGKIQGEDDDDRILQFLKEIKANQLSMMKRIKKIEESLPQEQKKTHEPENMIKQEPQAGDIPDMKDTKLN